MTRTCKWCSVSPSVTIFENEPLCKPCNAKAVHASQHPKLCSQCIKIFTEESTIEELFSEYGFSHSFAADLRASSEDGCGMCRMMWLQDPNGDEGRLQFTSLNLRAGRPKGVTGEGRSFGEVGDINSLYFSSEEGQFRLDMSVSALQNDPAASFVTQRPPEEDLGNDRTNCLIMSWLDKCLNAHPESHSSELSLLPTRVIDVGVGVSPHVQLLETPPDLRARYVTLSYCWGRSLFLTTVLGNVEAHKRKLDEDSLPQTFKDAITTTRNLGFRYIWIDALCIIQDSSEDKAKEIENMGNVYSGSTLTIAVVGAAAVAEGFLKPKAKQFVAHLPYRCPNGTIGSVRISPRREPDLWNEPLYTRAWCLQENLLSPRMLLYTDTEVVWQCQTSPLKRPNTSHVSYINENPDFSSSPFRRLPANILDTSDVVSRVDALSDAERYQVWRSLVENYTKRNLTVASDRLPALAGIVQKFRTAWNDNYIAGSWERQLLPSLAWRRSTEHNQPHYPALAEYRAPSWSWASIDGPVKFDLRFDLGNGRGMQAKIKPSDFNTSAEKKDEIVIEGYVMPVSLAPGHSKDRHSELILDHHSDDGRWPLIADIIENFNEEMRDTCWLLLLGEGRDGEGKMTRTTALVLMQLTLEDEDTFERIGLWKSTTKGSSKHWIQTRRREIKIK